MNDNAQHSSTAHNLDWLAFQYVCGELSDVDSTEFEEQLTQDPAACEAVARQVMICESIASLDTKTGTPDTPNMLAPVVVAVNMQSPGMAPATGRWIGIAITAVCLAIVVWAGSSVAPRPQSLAVIDRSVDSSASSLATSDELLGFWVDVKQDLNQPADLLSFQMDDILELPTDETDNSGEAVPDWMLAAVSVPDLADELMPEETRE